MLLTSPEPPNPPPRMLNDPSEAVCGFALAGGPLNRRDFMKRETKKNKVGKVRRNRRGLNLKPDAGGRHLRGPLSRE